MAGLDGDFILKRYEYELTRREELAAAIESPIVGISALAAAEITMIQSWRFHESDGWLPLFVFTALAFAIAIGFCFVYLLRSYVRQDTIRIPSLSDLADSRIEYLQAAKSPDDLQERTRLFDGGLWKRVADAADENTRRNDARSELLYKLRYWLVWLLIACLASAVPFAFNRIGG